ncbi:MAG: hypothetical protein DHS20C14_07250 [Phycisphaeraceae bacterium]|nr:MAG: hypothetical protein DHS20C14_07250 [Phycisphaeraceae bacterium]
MTAGVVLACAVPSAWGGAAEAPIDTSLRLHPEVRLADAVRSLPEAQSSPPEPADDAPTFAVSPSLLAVSDAVLPDLDDADGAGFSLSLNTGRSTTFVDGGIGDAGIIADEAARRARPPGYSGSDAQFDVYDLSLRQDAYTRGAFTLSLIGGVRAINVQASRLVDDTGEGAGSYASSNTFVPVPIVGTGVRFDLSDRLHVSGSAATHTIPDYATLLDFTAQTGLELNPNATFYAGYQSVHSSVAVDSGNADLSQEGLFARLRIRF